MRSPSELLVQVQQAELEAVLSSAFSSLRPLEVPQTALGGSLKASRGPRRLPKGFQESPGIMYQSGTTGDSVSNYCWTVGCLRASLLGASPSLSAPRRHP